MVSFIKLQYFRNYCPNSFSNGQQCQQFVSPLMSDQPDQYLHQTLLVPKPTARVLYSHFSLQYSLSTQIYSKESQIFKHIIVNAASFQTLKNSPCSVSEYLLQNLSLWVVFDVQIFFFLTIKQSGVQWSTTGW